MPDVANVDEVVAGDHACLTYSDPDERFDLLAAFVRQGLRRGERVLCWTDIPGPDQLASELATRAVRGTAAIRRGQLGIHAMDDSLLSGGEVRAATLLAMLSGQLDQATRLGYSGLRVTADMCWATRAKSSPEQLIAFENEVAGLFGDGRLCVICQYDRDRFDAVTLAFAASTHTKSVAALVYHDTPLLRICRQYSPPGIRVAGELDYRHQEALERALAESRRLDRHMHVNLSGLEYIDAACAATIVQTAHRLPASRRVTLTCRGLVGKVLHLVGAADVAQLRIHQLNDHP